MEYTYEVIKDEQWGDYIKRSDGAIVPTDLANTDYQAYLEHEASSK
jgi:hypothetical protein